MTMLNKRILLFFSAAIICMAVTLRAVAASSSTSVTVPVIDTNIPLYVLVDVSEIDTAPLGAVIIIR